MDKQTIERLASEFVQTEKNYVSRDNALNKDLTGMKIFDEPIFAYGSADDEGFQLLKSPSVIGEHFMMPREWLQGANTVIVYFFPFTDEVRKSNRKIMNWPSNEWLHGRIDGHEFISEFSLFLNSKLNDEGYKSLVPGLDSRFKSVGFSSNWSERHAAFISGLGTFGLSKGIITEKGMAGRLGSILTELKLKPDIKKYNSIYEYCINCGICAENCPAEAISTEKGKDHKKCSDLLDKVKEKHKPYYGCGKCQVGVPCENKNPKY